LGQEKNILANLWNLGAKNLLFTLKGHESFVNAVAVTADGQWAISGGRENNLKVWNLSSRKEVFTLAGHDETVTSVATVGNRVISVSDDNTLKVWDLLSQKVVASFRGDSALKACAIAPDGVTIVAAEASGQVHFLRLEEGE
jgi:WD40 repeat protein